MSDELSDVMAGEVRELLFLPHAVIIPKRDVRINPQAFVNVVDRVENAMSGSDLFVCPLANVERADGTETRHHEPSVTVCEISTTIRRESIRDSNIVTQVLNSFGDSSVILVTELVRRCHLAQYNVGLGETNEPYHFVEQSVVRVVRRPIVVFEYRFVEARSRDERAVGLPEIEVDNTLFESIVEPVHVVVRLLRRDVRIESLKVRTEIWFRLTARFHDER